MIISASRRTDIPAFYAPWFFNRLQEGYLLVPNPFDPRTLSRISLGRDVVDCIVFWTKNPAPMLPRLGELSGYNYYFQYTLNPYGADLEKHLPPLEKRIETFKRLSDKVGRDRVVWRYDPILTNAACDVDFHCEAFARIAHALRDHTTTCMLGFIDHYRHVRGVLGARGIGPLQRDEIQRMAVSFRRTVASTPIALKTCTAKVDLRDLSQKVFYTGRKYNGHQSNHDICLFTLRSRICSQYIISSQYGTTGCPATFLYILLYFKTNLVHRKIHFHIHNLLFLFIRRRKIKFGCKNPHFFSTLYPK